MTEERPRVWVGDQVYDADAGESSSHAMSAAPPEAVVFADPEECAMA